MKKMMTFILTLICFTTTAQNPPTTSVGTVTANGKPAGTVCPEKKITVQRLPDLTTPRAGHVTFVAGGEVMVVGGHTTGFVPTATAERLTDDKWEQMPTVYTHDEGFAVELRSGHVMLCGGHLQPLGIGNQFVTEEYDPDCHTFKGYGCLDRKRCWAQGLEMDSGHVVISGNWYEEDGVELYNGAVNNQPMKAVRQQRSMPYIFRTAKDDAIIFSSYDERARAHDTIWIDHLKGDATTEPLFTIWRPESHCYGNRSTQSFIGDEAKGDYSYLMAVRNRQTSHWGIMKVTNGRFSLLPTDSEVPMVAQGDSINWFSTVIADCSRGRAYMVGYGKQEKRLFILYIRYKGADGETGGHTDGRNGSGDGGNGVVSLLLGYTEPLPDIGYASPVLTADGNLMMAGGLQATVNNFEPYTSAVLLLTGDGENGCLGSACTNRGWIFLLVLGLIALGTIGLLVYRANLANRNSETDEPNKPNENNVPQPLADNEKLMTRIDKLMEHEQLFLNPELKVSDVAAVLNVNGRYVTDCINASRGCSFTQYVNSLRLDYAQRMMQESPNKKLSEVWAASGFANESTFFRVFKATTGITPKEWINGGN